LTEMRQVLEFVDDGTATALANVACSKFRNSGHIRYLGLLVLLSSQVTDAQVIANVGTTLSEAVDKNPSAVLVTVTKILDSRNYATLSGCLPLIIGEQTGQEELVEKFSSLSDGVVDWVIERAIECPSEYCRAMGDELGVIASGPTKARFIEALAALSAPDRSCIDAIVREKVASDRHVGIQLKLAF
jgi:hypothetical protein